MASCPSFISSFTCASVRSSSLLVVVLNRKRLRSSFLRLSPSFWNTFFENGSRIIPEVGDSLLRVSLAMDWKFFEEFSSDIFADFFHCRSLLEDFAAHVERYIVRLNDTTSKSKVAWKQIVCVFQNFDALFGRVED